MDPVATLRSFNRLYTRELGILAERALYRPYSLAETRVLWELAHRERPTAAAIARELRLDAGYLSRALARLRKAGLVAGAASETDARNVHLALTARGRKEMQRLEAKSDERVAGMLAGLAPEARTRLVGAARTVGDLLGGLSGASPKAHQPFLLRGHRPGDMGWVVHRHGALYAREYGYDERFEALVAEITARFVREFDPKRERCWIAEQDGAIVGSVFLVRHSPAVAKLRLLYVEPSLRGQGLGRRLVAECVRFARERGYRKITLWTQSELSAARRLYQQAGFRRVGSERHRSFGRRLVGENWELRL